MRTMGYIVDNDDSSIYPFVVNVGKVNCRLDILKRNSIDPIVLSGSGKYKANDVLHSVIYTKLTLILYSAGIGTVYKQTINKISDELKYALLVDGRITESNVENFSIHKVLENMKGGSQSQITGLTYTKIQSSSHLIKSNVKYQAREISSIQTLQYFIDEKDLKLETKDYRCLDTYNLVTEYVNSVDWKTIDYTAKDTETTGVDFYRDSTGSEIVGMSHSYKDKQGVYIPFRYRGENMLDVNLVFTIMKPIFNNTRQVFQNGGFDRRVFRKYGIEERVDEELTVLQRLINPSVVCPIDLKYSARVLLEEDTIELNEILGSNFDPKLVEWIPLDLITVYACGDTDYTRRIFIKLYNQINQITKNLYRDDVESYNIVCEPDWFGIPVRDKTNKELIATTKKDLKIMESVILDYVYKEAKIKYLEKSLESKGKDIKRIPEDKVLEVLESDKFSEVMAPLLRGNRSEVLDLAYDGDKYKILYELLDYPKLRYTDSGALSVGKEYFQDIDVYILDESREILAEDVMSSSGEAPLFEKNEVNSKVFPLGYLLSTYATKKHEHDIYVKLQSMQTGEYSFSQNKFSGTITGRITNMIQTIPKYAKGVIGFEEDSEFGLIDFDFDQVELRCAHNEAIRLWESMKQIPSIANNPKHIVNTYDWHKIVNIFNSYWSDVHKEMTASFNHCSPIQVTKKQRDAGKATNFATLYGGTAYSTSKNEMKYAKTFEQKQALLTMYEEEINKLFCNNIHLYNYFETSKELALEPAPVEELPYNVIGTNVGRTFSRSGRVRYYDLDNIDLRRLRKIMNAGRNQLIQSYARDIVFKAIREMTRRLEVEGIAKKDCYSGIFIHDEDAVIYNKDKINPLWLAVIIHKYSKLLFEGSPIYYYCSVSVCNNWKEGKNDKYEIPKEMLDSLSDDIKDYQILDTRNHRDYIYNLIVKFYYSKVISLLEPLMTKTGNTNRINLEDVNLDKNYYLLGKLGLYTNKVKKSTGIKELDNLLNIAYMIPNWTEQNNIEFFYNGTKLEHEVEEALAVETQEPEIEEFNIDSFMESNTELFDAETFANNGSHSETTTAEFGTSNEEIYKSHINKKSLEELNSRFQNVKSIKTVEYNMINVLVEPYTRQLTINLNPLCSKTISSKAFKQINDILKEVAVDCVDGYDLKYILNYEVVDANLIIPRNFNFIKFDKFIDKLRK